MQRKLSKRLRRSSSEVGSREGLFDIGPLRPAPPIGPVVTKLDPRVGRGAGDDSGSRAVGEVGKSPVHQDAKFVAKTD